MRTFLIFLLSTLLTGPLLAGDGGFPVALTVVVTPAYTPFLYQHQDHVILTVTNLVGQPQYLKFRGSITGDNGFSASTHPWFQPNTSFALLPFQTRTIVLSTSANNGFFNPENLQINIPPNLQDLIDKGLGTPEGAYRLCINAYEYYTGEARSEEACFDYNVVNAQPPLLFAPNCGDTVQQQFPVFNWSAPGSAFDPSTIRYDFYMVRLQSAQTDPYLAIHQAITSGIGNPLVKTGLVGTMYAVQPSEALFLEKGRYAWAVVVKDASNLLYIENGGLSEVCTFVYDFPPTITTSNGNNNPPFGIEKNTSIKGRLFYTYPTGNIPPPPSVGDYYVPLGVSFEQLVNHLKNQTNSTLVMSGNPGISAADQADLMNNKASLNNIFSYAPSLEEAYPVANAPVKLAMYLYQFNAAGQAISSGVMKATVGEATTDAQGNFEINFLSKDSLGQIARLSKPGVNSTYYMAVLKILVPDKHFCSPELNIEVQPGGVIDIGNVVSLIRSYQLTVKASIAANSPSGVIGPGQPVNDLEVRLGRRYDPTYPIFPSEYAHPIEGNNLNETGTGILTAIINGTPIDPVKFDLKVFSKAKTDSAGNVLFSRLTGIDEELYVAQNPQGDTVSNYSLTFGGGKFSPFFGNNSPHTTTTVFNRRYYAQGIPSFNYNLYATLKLPLVKGRVFEQQLGGAIDKRYVSGVVVVLYKNNIPSQTTNTGLDGKFEFRSLEPGQSYYVVLSKTGYVSNTQSSSILSYGDAINLGEIGMMPARLAMGIVQDEYGGPLPCYVQTGDGTIYETGHHIDPFGQPYYGFRMYSMGANGTPLKITPKSSSFFPKTFTITYPYDAENAAPSWGTYVLYERLHRVRVVVKDQTGQVIPNASVNLEEFSAQTGNDGVATFKFPSPGTQFYLQVSDAEGYSPKQIIITNNPSENDTEYVVILLGSIRLTGFVTAGSDQTPVHHAHVVALGGGKEFEAYTDAQGYYEIIGLPRDGSLTVSKESNHNEPLYIGKNLPYYSFPDPTKTDFAQDFNLTTRNDLAMQDIWGFKGELTSFYETSGGIYRCQGAITSLPYNENFKPKSDVVRVPFTNVTFKKTGETDSLGRHLIEPTGTSMLLTWVDWKVKLYNQYDATLKNPNGWRLQVQKNDGNGTIGGFVSSDLESFRFSYQYDGQFYLGENANDIDISVFKAKGEYPYRPFQLMNRDDAGNPIDLAFKVRTFPATASRDSSFVSRDSGFVIRTILHTNIPGMVPSDLKLDIGRITVTNEGIEMKKGPGNRIKFDLEKWPFEATTDWEFNVIEEGISIPKGNLYTGVVDPVLENILIKPDFFEVDINDVSGFTLGGVTDFIPDPECNLKLFYDPFDKHYQLTFLSAGTIPAGRAQLPALGQPIVFNNFTITSNGGFLPNIQPVTARLHEIVDCRVNTIQVTPGRIDLTSTIFLGVYPDISLPLNITYTKPADTIAYTLNPGKGTFATEGHVYFQIQDMQIKRRLLTATGTLLVKADRNAGSKDFTLDAFFTKTPDHIYIDVDGPESTSEPRQLIAMGAGKGLSVQRGRQTFASGQWNNLSFDAYFQGFTNVKQDQLNHYSVHGAVDMNEGKLELSSIETPFGGVKVVLDFNTMALHGTLEQGDVPIPMGPVTLKDLKINMDMDKQGFLLYGNAKGDIAGIFTDLGVGLMIGYYEGITTEQKNAVLANSLNHQFPSGWISDNFAGVYINASKELMNESLSLGDIINGYIYAGAQVDAMLSLAPIQFNARVAAAVSAELAFDLLVCDVCIGAAGEIVGEVQLGENGANLKACGSLLFAVEICDYGVNASKALELSAGSDGLDIKFIDECEDSIIQRDPCGD